MDDLDFEQIGVRRVVGKRPYLILTSFGLLFAIFYTFFQQTQAFSETDIPSNPIVKVKLRESGLAGATEPQYPAYGVNFISWAKGLTPVSDTRYANAKLTGASWNRWPLYWCDIEQNVGEFHWAYQDVAVENDLLQGFQLNAILIGTPIYYTTALTPQSESYSCLSTKTDVLSINAVEAATPEGLYDSVFTDGTDIPGEEKLINPDNRWARFVETAVNRYKPGGVLAEQNEWPAGQGVTHWEMWNEPDLTQFWDGTTADYARLLKVGYVAAKHADPDAQVLFGGLANNHENLNFYNDVMTIYDDDSLAESHAYFHDIFATHNYLYSWRSWYHVFRAGNTLQARNLDKPIWLNENGVPVWDDYPGPICEPTSPLRASMSEQADFIIQSAFYARYVGADNIFFFQLYDDCGNQGGNHEYYPPEACTGNPDNDPGGDAFGLFSNPASNTVCYSHHPNPEAPRAGLAALQVLTTYFTGVDPLWRLPSSTNEGQEWIAFFQKATNSRILGMWSYNNVERTAIVPTTNQAGNAVLIGPDNNPQVITAVNGTYTVTLPAATNQNMIENPPDLYPIEGRPFILIEVDDMPPAVSLSGPAIGVGNIPLTWQGHDAGSGVQSYDLQVQIDNNAPFLWLTDTIDISTNFPSQEGRTYRFTIIGRDQAGNEQASNQVTVFAMELPEKVYLPTIQK